MANKKENTFTQKDVKKRSGRLLRFKYKNNIGVGVYLAKKKGLTQDEYVDLVQRSAKKGLSLAKILLGGI